MPKRPKRPCTNPGCIVVHDQGGRCAKCSTKLRKQQDSIPERRADNNWYTSQRWRRTARAYKAAHPLCERCEAQGFIRESVEVHHIKDRKQYPELAYDWDNLEALCKTCHGKANAYGRLRE